MSLFLPVNQFAVWKTCLIKFSSIAKSDKFTQIKNNKQTHESVNNNNNSTNYWKRFYPILSESVVCTFGTNSIA